MKRSGAAEAWFDARGWTPLPFQREVWHEYAAGKSGLVHAPTGFGKSLGAWMGPLLDAQDDPSAQTPPKKRADAPPLKVVWVTPMRALASDLVKNLGAAAQDLAPGWLVESRSGDTSSTVRSRQSRRLPTALITTPESLTLLLCRSNAAEEFAHLECVVVDEWHELFGTKRGVQTELALARLRTFRPALRTWGLSATLGNLDEACEGLVGAGREAVLVRGRQSREIEMHTVVPESVERFPWAGHMGLRLLAEVALETDRARSAIVFTNTRAQAERWFQAFCYARYERRDEIALHHGSLDREERADVERRIADGRLWVVVATSSLDLGVDFHPVDLVVQVGSPKGVARLAQRAGRSGHSPGRKSRLVNVPTNALELVEFAAARAALAQGRLEPRTPIEKPLDVLTQHLVTVAVGGGFNEDELFEEVRTTASYRNLSREEFRWALDFACFGGEALAGYERFSRIQKTRTGTWGPGSKRVVREHRMNVGTITGFGSLEVKFRNGRRLGSIEELFLSRLRPGASFTFAGRSLELLRIEDTTAYVKASKKANSLVPRWMGGRMPLSNELAMSVREAMGDAARLIETGEISPHPEINAAAPLLSLQAELSCLPGQDELLIERIRTKDGDHAFLFPVEGRLVHEGLAALLAWRATRKRSMTVTQSANDWGVELLCRGELPTDGNAWRELLSPDRLLEDLLSCLDGGGLTKRHFREIARVAGLIHPGMPGQRKGQRQLQASSGLVYEVLKEHDPGSLLLEQARREVMDRTLEFTRLRAALESIATRKIILHWPERLTPLAFPLWAERVRDRTSSESWEDRVRAMAKKLEAGAPSTR